MVFCVKHFTANSVLIWTLIASITALYQMLAKNITQTDRPTQEQWFSVTPHEQSVNITSSSIGVSFEYSPFRFPNKWRRSWSTGQIIQTWSLLLSRSGVSSKESPNSYKTWSIPLRTDSVSIEVADVFAFVDHGNIRCFYATQNKIKNRKRESHRKLNHLFAKLYGLLRDVWNRNLSYYPWWVDCV